MPRNVGLACNITTGKLDANQAVKGGEYPFFTCAQYPDTIDSYAFDDDVVLVAGNNAQGNFHVSRFKGKFNAYQRTYVLTAKAGCNIDYIYYALKLELKRFRERSQGSQTKFLTMPILTGIHLKDLGFDEQSKIAKVLTSIDAKIELNNRINDELEAMAKTLYDYWFVQFDFPFDFAQGKPDANGKPYKSSGGRMVYNSTLKREIPEGWSVKTLGDVITRSGTGLNPRDNFKLGEGDNFYITIKDIEQGRINFSDKCDRVSDHALEVINKRSDLQKGDVLFTSIEPVGITYLLFEKPKNWNINESVFTLRANNSLITSEYLFMLLSSKETKAFCSNSSSGSVHKGIRHGVLKIMSFSYAGFRNDKRVLKVDLTVTRKKSLNSN